MSDGDTAMRVRADQLVLRDCDDNGILRLTLNDPKTRNSLSEAMMEALASASIIASDRELRVFGSFSVRRRIPLSSQSRRTSWSARTRIAVSPSLILSLPLSGQQPDYRCIPSTLNTRKDER